MATHSNIIAWRIPWTEEPGGLLSMGSQRIGHDWATNTYFLSFYTSDLLSMVIFLQSEEYLLEFPLCIINSVSVYSKFSIFFLHIQRTLSLCRVFWVGCHIFHRLEDIIPLFSGLYFCFWEVSYNSVMPLVKVSFL